MRRTILVAVAVTIVVSATALMLGRVGSFGQDDWAKDGVDTGDVPSGDPNVPVEHVGNHHCGWDEATLISFRGGLFFRDPAGQIKGQGDTYEPDAVLPGDATSTGWERGDQELWTDLPGPGANGVPRSLYLVTADRVERLPHLKFPCA